MEGITWKHLGLAACLALAGCAADPKEAAKFEPDIDRICAWTGLRRSGPIRRIEAWQSMPGHNVFLNLKAGGRSRKYLVRFEEKEGLLSFAPEPLSFIDLDKGLGQNDDIEPATRARCLAAVKQFNRHFKAPLHGPGTILRWHGTYIVTFETLSEAEVKELQDKKQIFLDAYVSFLVTPDGTIYGVFWGC